MAADGSSLVDDLLHLNTEATASKTSAPSNRLPEHRVLLPVRPVLPVTDYLNTEFYCQ